MAKSTFTARISNCTMSIALDVRHPKGETYPVCVRYCINTKRMYHPIGDSLKIWNIKKKHNFAPDKLK